MRRCAAWPSRPATRDLLDADRWVIHADTSALVRLLIVEPASAAVAGLLSAAVERTTSGELPTAESNRAVARAADEPSS